MQFKSERGFTLVELIVVIVIIGILAAVAVPRFTDLSDASKAAACKQNQASIESAAAIGYANNAIAGTAAYPSFDELSSLGYLKAAPTCPQTGTSTPYSSTYSTTNGSVTCAQSSGTHAHAR